MTTCNTSFTLAEREIYRGDSDEFSVFFKDELNNNIDITGWIIKMTCRENFPTNEINDADALFSVEATIAVGASGQAEIVVPSDDTKVDVGIKAYDIQYTKPDGTRRTLGVGKYTIKNDITRG